MAPICTKILSKQWQTCEQFSISRTFFSYCCATGNRPTHGWAEGSLSWLTFSCRSSAQWYSAEEKKVNSYYVKRPTSTDKKLFNKLSKQCSDCYWRERQRWSGFDGWIAVRRLLFVFQFVLQYPPCFSNTQCAFFSLWHSALSFCQNWCNILAI